MKNKVLSTAFCFAIISTFLYGQDSTFRKGYLRVKSQGNAYTRLAADSAMHIPLKSSLSLNDNDLSPQIFVKDSVLYYTVGSTYKVASSGAGSSFDGHYTSLIGAPAIPAPVNLVSTSSNVAVSGTYPNLTIGTTGLFSGSYTDLANKPTLFSGSYTDLANKPSIPAAQAASDWNATTGVTAIANKPSLFSGSYTDLANKPTLFNGAYSALTGTPTIPAAQVQSDWNASSGINAIANKPTIPTISAGTNTSITYSGGVYTINSTGSGSGSYVAPSTYTFTSTGSPTITLPFAYVSGSVTVSENGVPQANSFTQTSSTVITLSYIPFSGTTFVITYTKQ